MDKQLVAEITDILVQSDQTVAGLGLKSSYRRELYGLIDQKLRRFLDRPDNQWLLIPGLRGVGKTTLLTQIYNHPMLDQAGVMRFYLSFETLGLGRLTVKHLVDALKNQRQLYPDKLMIICFDEVHLEKLWSLGAKIIFDQISKSFLICTGSSALSLRLNPDSARRAEVRKMHPLNLPESLAILQAHDQTDQLILPAVQLSQKLQSALWESTTADQALKGIQACTPMVTAYYQNIQQFHQGYHKLSLASTIDDLVDKYINGYGSLPLFNKNMLRPTEKNWYEIQNKIKATINQTITGDAIRCLTDTRDDYRLNLSFAAQDIALLAPLVTILANSDQLSMRKIAKEMDGVTIRTLDNLMLLLVISDLITEIKPLGSSSGKNTKISKYLFGSPAIRQALAANQAGANLQVMNRNKRLRGALLEDTIAMYLERVFYQLNPERFIEYDSRSGGADFVVAPKHQLKNRIVVEVGYNKKTAKQVQATMQSSDLYGLIITNDVSPKLDIGGRIVYVPLEYFLLQ